MAKVATGRTVDLEPIERLEEKVKLLVGLVERLRGDHAAAVDENSRLRIQMESLQSRLADAEGSSAEMAVLREERDQIRARVADILEQLEAVEI
jgi:regulator of replication initiation timing